MVNDDQVEKEVFDSETIRPLRPVYDVLQPDVATHELDELNLVL
jgi:hypothetical protein